MVMNTWMTNLASPHPRATSKQTSSLGKRRVCSNLAKDNTPDRYGPGQPLICLTSLLSGRIIFILCLLPTTIGSGSLFPCSSPSSVLRRTESLPFCPPHCRGEQAGILRTRTLQMVSTLCPCSEFVDCDPVYSPALFPPIPRNSKSNPFCAISRHLPPLAKWKSTRTPRNRALRGNTCAAVTRKEKSQIGAQISPVASTMPPRSPRWRITSHHQPSR